MFQLKDIRDLNFFGSLNLKKFSEISCCNIKKLYLNGAVIEELPSSVECLSGLVALFYYLNKKIQIILA